MYKKPIVIGEIGCNHQGDLFNAMEMIDILSSYCKVDIVKFQKRDNKTLLTEEQYNSPHPNPMNSYGETYGEHREFLEFNQSDHYKLKKYCEFKNVEYMTSVWDLISAKKITELKPNRIKIPSACNLNKDLLIYLCENFKGEIHLSTGMTTIKELDSIIKLFYYYKRNNDLILYNCVSGYPVPFKDVSLLDINKLLNYPIKDIGFSGHHLGISTDIAAYTLGARYIERHFTVDRTRKGTDHAASVEPDGMRKLTRDLNNTYETLKYKKNEILEIEIPQRDKLKKDQIKGW